MGVGGYQVPGPVTLPSALHMGHNVKSGLRDSSHCSNPLLGQERSERASGSRWRLRPQSKPWRQPGSLREGRTGWAEAWMAECKQLGLAGGQLPLREGGDKSWPFLVGSGVGGVFLGETRSGLLSQRILQQQRERWGCARPEA